MLLESIRRYSKRFDVNDAISVKAILFGDVNGVVPGVIPPDNPGDKPPFDLDEIFDDSDDPQDVANAPDTGDDEFAARRDHKHKGVRSLSKLTGAALFENITLSEGTGIQLTQTGQDIKITNTGQGTGTGGGGGGAFPVTLRNVEYLTLSSGGPTSFVLQFLPIGDAQVYYDGFRKFKSLHYTQTGQTIAFQSVTPITDDRVIVEYFYNTDEQNLTISLDGISVIHRVVEYYVLLSSTARAFNLLFRPDGDVATYFDGQRKFKSLHYLQSDHQIVFDNSISFVDSDQVIFDYFYITESGDSSGTARVIRHLLATAIQEAQTFGPDEGGTVLVTVKGAVMGDTATVSFDQPLPDGVFFGVPMVVAPDTVRVTVVNESDSSQDVPAGVLTVDVWRSISG